MPSRISRKAAELAGDPHPAEAYSTAPGLKAAREAQGITLEALSELCGYPLSYLRRMEDEGLTAPPGSSRRRSPRCWGWSTS